MVNHDRFTKAERMNIFWKENRGVGSRNRSGDCYIHTFRDAANKFTKKKGPISIYASSEVCLLREKKTKKKRRKEEKGNKWPDKSNRVLFI